MNHHFLQRNFAAVFYPFQDRHVYKYKSLKRIHVFSSPALSRRRLCTWPDKVSSHYANLVKQYLQDENVNFVKRKRNPTDLQYIRLIEDFFDYLDSLVYTKGWSAKNLEQQKNRVKYCPKIVDPDIVRREM